jgi:hypothetical protein
MTHMMSFFFHMGSLSTQDVSVTKGNYLKRRYA